MGNTGDAPPTPRPVDAPEVRGRAGRTHTQTQNAKALEELRALIAERRRRRREDPLDFYRPLPHQARFHASIAQERLFAASNRSGKTESGVVEDVRTALGQNPHWQDVAVPNYGWVISVSNEAQRDILQPKFEKYLPDHFIAEIVYRRSRIWDQLRLKNGSIVGFKSCEQSRKVFQGTAIHWLHCDEEPPRDIFDEARTRLTDYQGRLWMTMTPIYGMDWSFDRWVDKETRVVDSERFEGSMWDNAKSRGGYLEDAEIKKFEDSIADPILKRIRVYGEYSTQAGRIFKAFDRTIHGLGALPQEFLKEDGSIRENYNCIVGLDTGRSFAAVFILVDYWGNLFVFDEYFGEDKTIAQHARAVLNICNVWGVWPDFVIDPSSQFLLDLAEFGINCTQGDNEVQKGIEAMQQYLFWRPGQSRGPKYQNPRFYVVASKCPRFMYEIQRYQWDLPAISGAAAGEKKNQPRKRDDHVMDATRYVCCAHPEPSRPGEDADDRDIIVRIRERAQQKLKSRAPGTNDETGLEDY